MEHKANNKVTFSVICVISMAAILARCSNVIRYWRLDTVNLSCSNSNPVNKRYTTIVFKEDVRVFSYRFDKGSYYDESVRIW